MTDQRQRIARLAHLAEALAWMDSFGPVAPQQVALTAALGRVLGADVTAPADLPPTAITLRDGYAVRADMLSDAGAYAPAVLRPPPEWVEVGATMPDGTDAVVPPDAVSRRNGVAEVFAGAVAGEGVLAAAADTVSGKILRRAGDVLRAVDVALLRAASVERVFVRTPLVRLVGATTAGHDVAAPMIATAIERDGGCTHVMCVGPDDEDALAQAIRDGSPEAVICLGGVGVGRRAVSVATLARVGTVWHHGIGLIPGETCAIGAAGTAPVLLLPDRLDAALAVYLAVGRPMLARLAGCNLEPAIRVTLAKKIVSSVGLAEIVLLRRRCERRVEPVASGVFPLQAIAAADGYVLIAPESEGAPAGTEIEMRPLP